MNAPQVPARCRLVLIAPQTDDAGALAARIDSACSGGDVASLILPRGGLEDGAFQAVAEAVTPVAQAHGVAVIVEGDARVAMRAKADGLYFEGTKADLADMVERHGRKLMVGTGNVKTRDEALELGETQPDFLFFGRIGYDRKPEPHSRNLGLGEWWSQMVAVPCIVLGGSVVASAAQVAAVGVEFVALEEAVFGDGTDPRRAVAEINALLDAEAPRLDG